MAISKKLVLSNGIEVGYHVITDLYVMPNNMVQVKMDNFISKSYYDKAVKKEKALNKQQELIKELENEQEESKRNELIVKINTLADDIDKLKEYINYVVSSEVVVVNSEDYSINTIEELVKNIL